MLRKLIRSIKFDGIKETVSLIINNIKYKIGLRSSNSYYFINSKNSNINVGSIKYNSFWLENVDQLKKYKILGRINNGIASEWLLNNNKLFVVEKETNIIAYIWVKLKSCKTNDNIIMRLNINEVWLGPGFVNKNYRSEGIGRFMIASAISKQKENDIEIIFTSISSKNYPSIINLMKNGFSLIGLYHFKKGIFCKNRRKIIDFTEKNYLKDRLMPD
jgi:GNAT superfamily N-acetyltransferase